MNKKLMPLLLSLSVGVSLWILFIFEGEMANYGIYTLVNYSAHEIMSLIPLGCIAVTLIWLVTTILKSINAKDLKGNAIALALLILASLLQIGYFSSQANQVSISTVARVERIDPVQSEIIVSKDGEEVTLNCPMTIFRLLEEDKEYLITYRVKKDTQNVGKVHLIQLLER